MILQLELKNCIFKSTVTALIYNIGQEYQRAPWFIGPTPLVLTIKF